MSLRDELLAVRDHYGTLTPANVVEAARPREHPLHSRFTWDDTEAAEKYRLFEAANLIRSVKLRFIRPSGESGKVRAFVRDPRTEQPSAYDETMDVVTDPVARGVLLAQMRREWAALKRRYAMFEEFLEMIRQEVEGHEPPEAPGEAV
jgi:hypothetical protein